MGRRNPFLPVLRCDTCGFNTKNTYIYKRHRIRCRREQRIPPILIKSEPPDLSDPVALTDMDTSDMAPPTLDYIMPMVDSLPGGEMDHDPESKTEIDAEGQFDDTLDVSMEPSEIPADLSREEETYKLPPPTFNRNYQCPDCNFNTTKSKMFLYHQVDAHKMNFNIYPCAQCEYASRYKHKIQRHMKLAHKAIVSSEGLNPEFTGDRKIIDSTSQMYPEPSETFVVKQSKSSKTKIVLSKKIKLCFSRPKQKTAKFNVGSHASAASDHLVRLPSSEGNPLYKCKLCLFNSNSRQKVYKHIHTCHINGKTYFCGLCDFSTNRKIEMYTHKTTHTGVSLYQCEECTYSTDSKPNFDRHMINHTKRYSRQCDFCSYSSDHIGALKRHMANNHQNNEENISVITAGEDQEEPVINEVFTEDLEENVLDDEKMFRCKICGLRYKRSGDLNRHMKLKHNLRLRDYLGMKMKRKQNRFNKVSKITKVSTVTSEAQPQPEPQQQQPLDLSDDSPTKMPNLFISKERLKCSYCSYLAKWPSDLRRHEVVHSVEKRYKCPHCLKKYKYIGDLNVHVRRDHKKEPGSIEVLKVPTLTLRKSSPAHFKCPCCPYKTALKSDIDRHSRLHKNGKPYHCNFCEYQTHWKGDIRRHVYKRHPAVMEDGIELEDVMTIHPENFIPQELPLEEQESPTPKTPQIVIENVENDSVELFETASSPTKSTTPSPIKDNNGVYRCEYCEFTTNAPSKLKCHVSTHLNLKQYKCPICGRRANWKWDVRKHIRKEHPETSLDVVKLSIKEAESTIKEYLETNPTVRREHHLNTSEGFQTELVAPPPVKRNYRCSACPFRSSHRWAVSRHIRTVHEADIANVDIVTEELTEAASTVKVATPAVIETTSTEKPPPPKIPTPIKSSPTKMASSPALLAALTSDKQATDIIEKPYMCAQCGKRSTLKGDVKKHYMYVHPGQEVRIIYLHDGSVTVMPCTNTISPALKASMARKAKSLGSKAKHFSSAKAHGYIKPFKCSICGHRSNWKWDLNKHILSRHHGDKGYVITLSIEEARATYADECMQQNKSPKQSPSKRMSEDQSLSPARKVLKTGTIPSIGVFRQFKCSNCPYRTNWRNDLHRHINRKHGKTKARIIYLDAEHAKETLADYKYNPKQPDKYPDSHNQAGQTTGGHTSSPAISGNSRIWKCSKCSFSNKDKMAVVNHLSLHNIKAFRCTICGHSSNYRSAMYRHLRGCHGQNDISFLRCGIRCVRESESYEDNNVIDAMSLNENVTETPMDEENSSHQVWACYVCSFQSNWRSCVCRHLREKHSTTDYSRIIRTARTHDSIIRSRNRDRGHIGMGPIQQKSTKVLKATREKRFRCHICPFRSNKRTLLNFHIACHKPRPGTKQVKCKHCPYWVRAERLLSQHTRLHFQEYTANVIQTEMPPPRTPVKHRNYIPPPSPKRHHCEKCPYTSNSKNDFLYHKQFHRPKPAAEFKCEHCDYWVTHKRLLKQHTKLHEEIPVVNNPGALGVFSAHSSPCKSDFSECSVNDMVEIASIKQRLISTKITSSLSQSPAFSPMKLASQCSIGGRPGYVLKNGVYKKLHKCRNCPYMNVRTRNLKLHEMMHGSRLSDHPLMKCPHCDYHVGSKGLLSHHLKVHQPTYTLEMTDNITELEKMEGIRFEEESEDKGSETTEIPYQNKVDTLLEIARFKKYSCEKCPYASAKRAHFERHSELHGSKQRHVCEYCDYSVPSYNLLVQHCKLHMMPNQNLLAAQSISNLQHLPEVPADVALASAVPVTESGKPVTVSITHDHIELYENSAEFNGEPKKLYRCDRCPYANVRRDHLLTHLKFHMLKSDLACPYCDYSVSKQHLLAQHIKIHFSPLPELSTWLAQNGQMERVEQTKEPDISEALEIAQLMQTKQAEKNGIKHVVRDSEAKTLKNVEIKKDENREIPNVKTDGNTEYIEGKDEKAEVNDDKLVETTVARCNFEEGVQGKEKSNEVVTQKSSSFIPPPGSDLPSSETMVENDGEKTAPKKKDEETVCNMGEKQKSVQNSEDNGDSQADKFSGIQLQDSLTPNECDVSKYDLEPVKADLGSIPAKHASDSAELNTGTEKDGNATNEHCIKSAVENKVDTCQTVTDSTGVNEAIKDTESSEKNGGNVTLMDDSESKSPNEVVSEEAGPNSDWQQNTSGGTKFEGTSVEPVLSQTNQTPLEPVPSTSSYNTNSDYPAGSETGLVNGEVTPLTNGAGTQTDVYICQYCDREFLASDQLLRHEMQHLIGNHFEVKSLILHNGIPNSESEPLKNNLPMDSSEDIPQESSVKENHQDEPMLNIQIKQEPMDLDEYQ
ncbi:hypothetical protein ScPMuIL_000472 [Solemya velum]